MLLLDTNVVSELRKVRIGKSDPNVAHWAESLDTSSLFVSAISIQELEIGVLLAERRDPTQGSVLRLWFETLALPAFQGRVLPVDTAVARRAADPRPINNALIGATALVHGMTLATRNLADFQSTGVSLLNPWRGAC